MEYPLISEYREAILSPEDNFNVLTTLRPVLDAHGDPVMSSGNFAVVFKMQDSTDGKFYAVKCFIKDQEGRDESYRKIADELELISSPYILPLSYLENELFVDSRQCDREEFSVAMMEWVDGVNLDTSLKSILHNSYETALLSYRFNRMAAWLLSQPFAHGDLKPDNILVRPDGSLVLVDYDGMFVPSMQGEKAREFGSPDYRHPLRSESGFNEHIDDFSIALIALSLKALSLNPRLKPSASDRLLFSESDFRAPSESEALANVLKLTSDGQLSTLLGIFYIALAKNSLDSLSFRLFMTPKPGKPQIAPAPKVNTSCSEEEIARGITDEHGVTYSLDGKRLLKCSNSKLSDYSIKEGTQIICDEAFSWRESLQSINIPDSVSSIGNRAFFWCESLQHINIPNSVSSIGDSAFIGCESLQNINIPDSVSSIGDEAFYWCKSLQSINIPDSVSSIGNHAFSWCGSLRSINIPDSVSSIGNDAFSWCKSLDNATRKRIREINPKSLIW